MSKEHTPGPWVAHQMVVEATKNGQKQIVATTREWEDARLIAEAPAMLELLKRGLLLDAQQYEYGECHCPLCTAAREIVARIEGE